MNFYDITIKGPEGVVISSAIGVNPEVIASMLDSVYLPLARYDVPTNIEIRFRYSR